MKKTLFLSFLFLGGQLLAQQTPKFNGIDAGMSNIYRLSDAKTRSISPENFNGAKGGGGKATTGTGQGASRDLGQGWKVSPSVVIKAHTTFTIAEIDGSGSIQHIWMTPTGNWRYSILRFYWDDETTPSVETPVATFLEWDGAGIRRCTAWRYVSIPEAPSTVTGLCLFVRNAGSPWRISTTRTWCCITRSIIS